VEPTRNSLRSSLAPAIARGSPPALDAKGGSIRKFDDGTACGIISDQGASGGLLSYETYVRGNQL